jgi:hypothetical protein
VDVLVGRQYGGEGKGNIAGHIAPEYDSSTEELHNILGRMSEEVSGLVTKYGIRVE